MKAAMNVTKFEYEPLISVVVPIYNVEDVLRAAVDSLLLQSYRNLDIILVDDGSTDSSGHLADSYLDTDSRVQVIHQANGGLSAARNTGISRASGLLITFLDSDDILASDYILHLYEAMSQTDADISVSEILPFKDSDNDEFIDKSRESKRLNNSTELKIYNSETAIIDLLYMRNITSSAFGKLYKKSLFTEIEYPVGKLYEDIGTTVALFDTANRIVVINNQDYYYRLRSGSIQRSGFSMEQMDLIKNIESFFPLIQNKYPKALPAYKSKMVSAAFNLLLKTENHTFMLEPEQKYLWKYVCKYRANVLFDLKARKKARIASLISYLGIKSVRLMYKQFHRLKR
jgi:glycosyltransferase involved in cell wall biosynthesis